jgi:hypothetical protein
MILLLLLLSAGILILIVIGFSLSAPKYDGNVSDHFNGKRFINPGKVKAKGLPLFLNGYLQKSPRMGETNNDEYGPSQSLVKSGIRVTFINHSTFLIQLDGLNILTDPIWSERASPFSWSGPKRMRKPGIKLEDLPHIHAVLLSHNHYDHLDIVTLKKITDRFRPRIFTGLGIGDYLEKNGIDTWVQMDWWQEFLIDHRYMLTSVPPSIFRDVHV